MIVSLLVPQAPELAHMIAQRRICVLACSEPLYEVNKASVQTALTNAAHMSFRLGNQRSEPNEHPVDDREHRTSGQRK